MYQVAETLSEEILTKIHAPPKTDYPVATPETLREADAILFGFPTRFGALPAQVKALFDSCGGLWAKGALVGKPAGFFFSTGTIAAGQETTAFTAVTFLAHQGMTFVPLGFRAPEMFNMDEMSALEKAIATTQGKSFAEVAKKLSA
ncbi:NAD(P)H:quinone oxidoreductase, type IV [Phytophthora cinnamomi]|uniref:NAD(P)H:quinone oxidoreductase, type IV n=1 Tax=Phytophthora cinnamomi TaxID=4785 RepID=UPI00355982AF|nr:NAD(P)H:quinone oxidoreductase, type IV [Phytophthora cinnamomi]KAG6602948.1 NAD(P)H:quinone oxidoreductase, type IV [Phytophthora cinnamomi]